jgi:hypothetical protein
MGMRIKALKDLLWSALAERIERHGFRGRRSRREFERNYEFGKGIFALYLLKYSGDFDVTASVFVRHDRVEDVVHRDANWLTEKQKEESVSIGADVGKLTVGEHMRWTVASDADVAVAAAGVEHAFLSVALPYIDRFGDLDTLYRVLSSDKEEDWIHCPVLPARARCAVVIALLLRKGDDEIGRLVQQIHGWYRETEQFPVQQFDGFLRTLRDERFPTGR